MRPTSGTPSGRRSTRPCRRACRRRPSSSFSRSSTAPRPKRTTPWPSRPSAARSPWKARSRATSRKRRSPAWTPRSPRPRPRCSPCWRSSRPTGTGSTSSTTAGGSCSARPREAAPGKDFTTWDLPRLFAEIDKHFQKALAAEEQLKKIPVAGLRRPAGQGHHARQLPAHALRLRGPPGPGVLQLRASRRRPRPKTPSSFRPTAPSSGRWRSSSPGRPRQEASGYATRLTLKAIRLYQELLRFHQNDSDKSALLDADLERLSVRPQQGGGRGEGRALQSGLAAFREAMGRPSHLGHRPLPLGRSLAAGGLAGRGPRPGPAGGPGLSQHARRQPVLQPHEADRGQVGRAS